MRTTILLIVLVACAALPARLLAQSPERFPAGTVVRWHEGRTTRVGRLVVTPSADAPLAVRARGEHVDRELAWDTPGLEYQSRKSRKGRGTLIGLGVGAAVGVMAGFVSGDDPCDHRLFGCLFAFTAEQKAAMFGVSLGGIGALIGAIAAPGARWTAVGPAAPPRLALLLTSDRVGVRVGF